MNSRVSTPYWALITRNTIPDCYKKTYEERCALLSLYPGYVPPKLIEMAICTTFEFLENGQKLFPQTAPSWMRWTQCEERSEFGDPVCLGEWDEEGVGVFSYPGRSLGGMVGVLRLN